MLSVRRAERVSIALRIASGLVAGKFAGLIASIYWGKKTQLLSRSVVYLGNRIIRRLVRMAGGERLLVKTARRFHPHGAPLC